MTNLHLPVLRRASGLKGRHRGVGELAFARKQVEVEIAEKLVRIPVLNFELNKQVFHLKLEFEFFNLLQIHHLGKGIQGLIKTMTQ